MKLKEKHEQIFLICNLAAMEKPSYRTIARFKKDYKELIDEAFKITIKIAKENDLIKVHHLSLDGTKIKAKTSINKLTDENQLKIMEKQLKRSIELDEQEDEELGDESGNSVPKSLTDKERFKETVKEIEKASQNDRNQDKLRSSSKKLLKQAEKSSENKKKILKKVTELEEKLKSSHQVCYKALMTQMQGHMLNKKGKWEWDYNAQIVVDEYKGIILTSHLTQNPTGSL